VTTIAFRDGIIAADSRETWDDSSYNTCEKLFVKRVGRRDVVIGTAGGSFSGMVFVDWYGSGAPVPEMLATLDLEEDFCVLVIDRGDAYVANHLCRLVKTVDRFVAIGSGRQAALAAMHCGKSAKDAVEVAKKVDPYTGGRVVSICLDDLARKRATKR
jgi:ATP-dependent protease HslVU (ClpYQ) peptidase subunit